MNNFGFYHWLAVVLFFNKDISSMQKLVVNDIACLLRIYNVTSQTLHLLTISISIMHMITGQNKIKFNIVLYILAKL